LDRLDQLRPDDWVVLELSSFQLESISRPRLRIGVVLNVTPDHVDRHKYFERYIELKPRAVAFLEPHHYALRTLAAPGCAASRAGSRRLAPPMGRAGTTTPRPRTPIRPIRRWRHSVSPSS